MDLIKQMDRKLTKLLDMIEDIRIKQERGKQMLPNVINSLKKLKMIDEEDVAYKNISVPFDWEILSSVFSYLGTFKYETINGTFKEYRSYFKYKTVRFIYRTMVGQGTVSALYLVGADKRFPYKKKMEVRL